MLMKLFVYYTFIKNRIGIQSKPNSINIAHPAPGVGKILISYCQPDLTQNTCHRYYELSHRAIDGDSFSSETTPLTAPPYILLI